MSNNKCNVKNQNKLCGKMYLSSKICSLDDEPCKYPNTKSIPCNWSNYEGVNGEDTDTHWSTSCGKEFILNDGTPEDNDMEYCCYCGKPIDQLVET